MKGASSREEGVARGDVAGDRTRLDQRGALPVLAEALVILERRLGRDGDVGRAGIGPEAQVGAEDVAVGGVLVEELDEALGELDEERATAPRRRQASPTRVEEDDEVDVARIVELARAELAHAEDDPAGAAVRRVRIGERRAARPRPPRASRKRAAAPTAASAKAVSASVTSTTSQTPPRSARRTSSAISSGRAGGAHQLRLVLLAPAAAASSARALQALRMVAKYLVRAVEDPSDDEARANMMLAASYAGLGFGTAGVHLPHGMSYPVSSNVTQYLAPGYAHDHPMVPHGVSVILNAPAVFRFTAAANPARHLAAAEALGANVSTARDADAGKILADRITWFMQRLRVPNGLRAIGYSSSDIPALVAGTLPQHRVTKLAPRQAGPDELSALFEDAMVAW